MRLISGTFKGRRFQLPKNLKARPTTDFAKENLFNVLSNQLDFDDLSVLDLFAGTGSIGFEFASRGASKVTFVEKYAPHVRFIKEVAEKLPFPNAKIINGDVFRFINSPIDSYDIVFADAPYAEPKMQQLPDLILNSKLLKDNGLLIVEHGKSTPFTDHPFLKEQRIYGSVHFSLFVVRR